MGGAAVPGVPCGVAGGGVAGPTRLRSTSHTHLAASRISLLSYINPSIL